jgi:tRNA (mo5U34)-methyltransferase
MKYLDILADSAEKKGIAELHRQRQQWVSQDKKGFLRHREPYLQLAGFPARHLDFENDAVVIGRPDELSDNDRHQVENALRRFMPWRKGPFSIYGIEVDAEWRSERKWRRLLPVLPDLQGKIIADIGCNNGYYMFRMVPYQPRYVLGFEPTVQHYYCFQGLNSMAGCRNLDVDLLGVEHLDLFGECFDVIFCMGIIYHRPSPIDTLRNILAALKPGGTLLLETQAIPGEEPLALFPDKTYAKVPGTYFVPTGSCLENWLAKAGFVDIDLFCRHPMTSEEQRCTDWMVFESFSSFIQPDDPTRTVEGYPAPWRIFIRGNKKA